MLMPSSVQTPDGVQAASATGMLSLKPRADTMSEKRNRRNPLRIPPITTNVALLREDCRSVNVAAINTIPHSKSGAARRECQ